MTGAGTEGEGKDDDEGEGRRRRTIDVLAMKERILLSYLRDVAGLGDDDALIPRWYDHGDRGGRGRRGTTMRRETNDDACSRYDYYGNSYTSCPDDSPGDDAPPSNASRRGVGRGSKASAVEEGGISSTNRLDRIKSGERLSENNTHRGMRPLQKRNTMMSMKSQMRVEIGMSPLRTMDEVRYDEEKARRRREDRKRMRLKRHGSAFGGVVEGANSDGEEVEFDGTTSGGESPGILKTTNVGSKAGDSADEEKKSEEKDGAPSDSEGRDGRIRKGGVRWAGGIDGANAREESHDIKPRGHTKVFCPVCQVILTVDHIDDGDTPDGYLAKHISTCQQNSRTRNGGRTLRKRTRPAIIDLDNEETDDGGYEDEIPSTAPTLGKPEAADDDSQLDLETTDDGGKRFQPSSACDDMDELDYEDRVDDWIERGLEEMGDMAERDISERPPGAIVFEGGLEIPAWINDRLFPYQRIGVRWMWELHCQGAGGVGE